MVNRATLLFVLIGSLLTASATVAEKVRIRWLERVDVSSYHTYSWQERPERRNKLLEDGSRTDNLIRGAIDEVLEARGFKQVSSEPDFQLTYGGAVMDTFQARSEDRMASPLTLDTAAGPGASGTAFQEGTLVVQLIAGEDGEVVCLVSGRGLADQLAVMSPKEERKLEKLAKRIARKLPLP